MLKITVITLFPDAFPGCLGIGVVGNALKRQEWALDVVNLRDFGIGVHKKVDDTPYGGGAGMVLKPDVLGDCLSSIAIEKRPCYAPSPRGEMLTQGFAKKLSQSTGCVLICGRYEGIDQRVLDAFDIRELSIGDYVLAGGEIAAQVVVESAIRLVPGVLGNDQTLNCESFSNDLLEYPHYTKPVTWQGLSVPQVLQSGNHAAIDAWRLEQQQRLTQVRRPDLWQRHKDKE